MKERRRERRAPAREIPDVEARVRPGHAVSLVDLSPSGALIEARRPLRPGTRVHVQLDSEGERTAVSARVVRCLVAAIDAERGITYRAALAFEDRCGLVSEEATHHEYALPKDDGGK